MNIKTDSALEACVEKMDMIFTDEEKEKAVAFVNAEAAIVNAQNDALENFGDLPYKVCRIPERQVHIFRGLIQLSFLVNKPWEATEREVFFMWDGIKFFELRENILRENIRRIK